LISSSIQFYRYC